MQSSAQHITFIGAIALSLSVSGCAFVSLTDAGAQVRQSTPDAVAGCNLVATISSQTKSKVVVDRNTDSVREELIVLARNRAAEMGANAVVPVAEQSNGNQDFSAYRCP